jgi:DNA-binding XRE family transcriptional regulator
MIRKVDSSGDTYTNNDLSNILDTMSVLDVGARLRSVRQMHGLSQRELARRAGVTNGLISLIEHEPGLPRSVR